MPKFQILKRTPKNKGIYVLFSRYEGFIFINRSEKFYIVNIYCKECISEDNKEIKKIIEQIKDATWIKDVRLKKGFIYRVELKNYPALNIVLKEATNPALLINPKEQKEDNNGESNEPNEPTTTDQHPAA